MLNPRRKRSERETRVTGKMKNRRKKMAGNHLLRNRKMPQRKRNEIKRRRGIRKRREIRKRKRIRKKRRARKRRRRREGTRRIRRRRWKKIRYKYDG